MSNLLNYLEFLMYLKRLNKSYASILLEFLKLQKHNVILINKEAKALITKEFDISEVRVNQAITDFVKENILIKQQNGIYTANLEILKFKNVDNISVIDVNVSFTNDAISVTTNVKYNKKEQNDKQLSLLDK